MPEYADLVALWISQHHPRNVALPDVNARCPECNESLNLGVVIVGAKVEMKAVLDQLGFVDGFEDESWEPIWLWPNLELTGSSLTMIQLSASTTTDRAPPGHGHQRRPAPTQGSWGNDTTLFELDCPYRRLPDAPEAAPLVRW